MIVSKKFIKQLQQFDKSAFEELYDNYAGLIKTIAFRYVKNWDVAEDIIQETFITVYKKILQYTGKGSLEGWIKRIAINNCLKFLKDQQKYFFEDIEGFQIANETETIEVDVENADLMIKNADFSQEEILTVVSSLPDGFRIVFSMYVLDDFKHKDIAEMLNISESTSKSQLLRARKLIQKKLYILAKEKYIEKSNDFYKDVIGKKAKNE